MAEQMDESQTSQSICKHSESKIPRYKALNSKIPVLSKSYKSELRDIKKKKENIERQKAEIEILKRNLTEIKHHKTTGTATEENARPEATEELLVSSSQPSVSPYSKSEIRTTIVTPKGTKRKVRPSHIRFQEKLDEVLKENIVAKEDESLPVDDLLRRLYSHDFLKAMGKRDLLKEISKKLKITVKYRGKARKGYYDGVVLTENSPKQHSFVGNRKTVQASKSSPDPVKEFTSPVCKQMRGRYANTAPGCKTQLLFQGMTSTDEVSGVQLSQTVQKEDLSVCESTYTLPDMDNLAQQLKSIEVSSADVITDKGMGKEIQELTSKMTVLLSKNKELSDQLSEVQGAFDEYVLLSAKIMSKQESITELYKEIVQSGQMLGGLLSISEKDVIKNEINMAKQVFDLGLRGSDTKDLTTILNPLLFEVTLEKLHDNCPTIVSVLEQLVLSPNAARNKIKTPEMKMKAAVHLLASLIDVRDQNAQNDITILFGLLCLCFGAGPSMIGLLQRLGLSESYPVLIKILKTQLQNYKMIIQQRVTNDCPVVTFQDNMQLMRTSLRHLRLSKLHKEKVKQNKMWDFTVRGWRVADITGIEDLFQDESTIESQQVVKDLKYDNMLIDNNQGHQNKWTDFQDRNTLRKMDVALNVVNMSKEQLKTMSSEELQAHACAPTPSQSSKTFKIKVPEIPCEFPDMAKKEAKIYPLPISHENQCTTLGVASNLDLFQVEFGFTSNKQEKYLPLKSSGKDFDLDKAYKRFAFLKKLEQHKKQQQSYEHFLRGQEHAVSVAGQSEDGTEEEILVVVDQESDGDSQSD